MHQLSALMLQQRVAFYEVRLSDHQGGESTQKGMPSNGDGEISNTASCRVLVVMCLTALGEYTSSNFTIGS